MNVCRIATACALLLLLVACARGSGPPEPLLAPPAAEIVDGEAFQTGTASWYGEEFDGATTADGEVYDMNKLTAAHRELPFHTLVEVENLENGRRVVVRINDRGPLRKDRVIDLSFKAAQQLRMTEKGTAEVALRLVRRGGDKEERGTPPEVACGCFVQAGAFSVRENADERLMTLNDLFPDLPFRVAEEEGLFKVISPRLDSAAECRDVLRKLSDFRIEGFIRDDDAPASE